MKDGKPESFEEFLFLTNLYKYDGKITMQQLINSDDYPWRNKKSGKIYKLKNELLDRGVLVRDGYKEPQKFKISIEEGKAKRGKEGKGYSNKAYKVDKKTLDEVVFFEILGDKVRKRATSFPSPPKHFSLWKKLKIWLFG